MCAFCKYHISVMGGTVSLVWCVEVLTRGNCEGDSGNRVFADVMELSGSHTGLGWALNAMTGVLISRERVRSSHSHRGKMACEDSAGLERYSYRQGNSWDCRQPPEVRKRQGRVLSQSADTSPASRTVRINFCCFQLPSLWQFVTAAPRKLIQ